MSALIKCMDACLKGAQMDVTSPERDVVLSCWNRQLQVTCNSRAGLFERPCEGRGSVDRLLEHARAAGLTVSYNGTDVEMPFVWEGWTIQGAEK